MGPNRINSWRRNEVMKEYMACLVGWLFLFPQECVDGCETESRQPRAFHKIQGVGGDQLIIKTLLTGK